MNLRERWKGFRAMALGLDPGMSRVYYRWLYKIQPNTLAAAWDHIAQQTKPFQFLQIGGNDGFANDPIFRFVKRRGWRGIIAEPQKEVFQRRLRRTYRNERRVVLANVAIAAQTGTLPLYKIAVSQSRWATGLATFERDVLVRAIQSDRLKSKAKREGITAPPTPEHWITTEDVQCTTIHELMLAHGFQRLDLLQIDTEGYDFEIIKTIDFERVRPRIICFENLHLDATDTTACHALLTAQGYHIRHFGSDTMASLDQHP